ncbi:MAG: rod shape-determining protein MreC, partial [Psychromonas sp.]|nr:rod shape-determining protein MreC [Psychromonas sp.]
SHVNYQKGALYADVTATPTALLDRSRYLLLLWDDHQFSESELSLDLESEDVTVE